MNSSNIKPPKLKVGDEIKYYSRTLRPTAGPFSEEPERYRRPDKSSPVKIGVIRSVRHHTTHMGWLYELDRGDRLYGDLVGTHRIISVRDVSTPPNKLPIIVAKSGNIS
jgi:hypothetical protein